MPSKAWLELAGMVLSLVVCGTSAGFVAVAIREGRINPAWTYLTYAIAATLWMWMSRSTALTLWTASILYNVVYELAWAATLAWMGAEVTATQLTGLAVITAGLLIFSR